MSEILRELNIIICGVGGQGNMLLERIIGISAIKENIPVRAADTFGAAQRGGSVLSHLRLGSEVSSSLIPRGKCHIILGLEPGDTLNTSINFLCEDGIVVVNRTPVMPAKVKVGEWTYPPVEEILTLLRSVTRNVVELNASQLAKQLTGSPRAMNIVIAGVSMGLDLLPLNPGTVKETIAELTGRFAAKNIQAFEAGFKIGKSERIQP